jgi:hypothetical protein
MLEFILTWLKAVTVILAAVLYINFVGLVALLYFVWPFVLIAGLGMLMRRIRSGPSQNR